MKTQRDPLDMAAFHNYTDAEKIAEQTRWLNLAATSLERLGAQKADLVAACKAAREALAGSFQDGRTVEAVRLIDAALVKAGAL